jgi:hypothetical protein
VTTLRFGLLCNGTILPAWQARCLEKLLATEDLELALLILDERPGDRKGRGKLLWALYSRMFVMRRSLSLRLVDMSAAVTDAPVLHCHTTSQDLEDAEIDQIRRHRLDFILFLSGNMRGEILEAARYGVWSFHHGDEQRSQGGPPCFWEIYRGDPVTGARLHRLTDRPEAGIVLHRGFFRTIDQSYVENLDQAHFGSAEWPARVCADIRNGNTAYLDGPPTMSEAPNDGHPGGAQLFLFVVKLLRNFARSQWRQVWRADHWNVGLVDAPIHSFLDGGPIPPVRWLRELPRGRFMADPFGIADGDRVSILVEEFDYESNQGRIASVEPTAGQSLRRAMDLEAHAAYPFVFRHDGSIYCVPSMSPGRQVDLFRATEFPTSWERTAGLVTDFAAQDATVFAHEGRWWLFCTDYEEVPNTKLHAWFAAHPAGPWQPHPLNPLKTDVRSSRPGGTPFVHEGRLYRPAQDDSRSYGSAVVLNWVMRLTPTEFAEQTVARVDPVPGPYSGGLHTLSAVGDRTLVDGKRFRFAWTATRRQLRGKLQKLFPSRLAARFSEHGDA